MRDKLCTVCALAVACTDSVVSVVHVVCCEAC
jgi:hypothetical protein